LPEIQKNLKDLKRLRESISSYLPVTHSLIPLDILLTVYCGDEHGLDLTIKSLFASLPYSDMGIRHHFKKLLGENWIELHNGDKDSRLKRVRATEKLKQNLIKLDNEIKDLFE
jgi:hypothetical protein